MRTKNPETFKAIEEFVNEYTERHGVSPTVREIHAGIGLAVGTVSRYLSYMVAPAASSQITRRRPHRCGTPSISCYKYGDFYKRFV